MSAADLTMLVALAFVLARNIVKLVVERRRALPFCPVPRQAGRGDARADDRPVGAGADRRQRADSQQRRAAGSAPPIDDVLRVGAQIAERLLPRARSARSRRNAARIARALPPRRCERRRRDHPARDRARGDRRTRRRWSRCIASPAPERGCRGDAAGRRWSRRQLPPVPSRGAADALAARVARRQRPIRRRSSRSTAAASWCAPARSIRDRDGAPVGVVIASDHLSGELATHARRITEAYERLQPARGA